MHRLVSLLVGDCEYLRAHGEIALIKIFPVYVSLASSALSCCLAWRLLMLLVSLGSCANFQLDQPVTPGNYVNAAIWSAAEPAMG